MLTTAEIFCKVASHVGAQVISHCACDNTCIYLTLKRNALYLQLIQV